MRPLYDERACTRREIACVYVIIFIPRERRSSNHCKRLPSSVSQG